MEPENHSLPEKCRLDEIFKIIENNQTVRKETIKHFDSVFKHIQNKLKAADPFFEEVQDGGAFIGDHGLDIQIDQSNRFQFEMHLCLPCPEELVVTPSDGKAELSIENLLFEEDYSPLVLAKLREFSDEEFILIPSRITDWFTDLMTNNIPSVSRFDIDENSFELMHWKKRRCGAGHLLRISVNDGAYFEVKIIPCIKLNSQQHWISDKKMPEIPSVWTASTKKVRDEAKSFRCSYENIEKTMLGSVNHLTDVLKLMMKIRDKDQIKPIYTVFLKTVCLNYAENTDSLEEKDLKTVFISVFKTLLQTLQEGRSALFWESKDDFEFVEHPRAARFRHFILMLLGFALDKVCDDKFVLALCNRNERLFYYGIRRDKQSRLVKEEQLTFKNCDLPIPNKMRY